MVSVLPRQHAVAVCCEPGTESRKIYEDFEMKEVALAGSLTLLLQSAQTLKVANITPIGSPDQRQRIHQQLDTFRYTIICGHSFFSSLVAP